ncbi:U32 family peptidase [Streptomyces sp. NBC_01217]|uniref:U32 family peptidase n=1 Tax=Streptomyces sp. NBC_01217 TaxID=2903779 RepID=UPI002E0E9593|nr:U32 family peptidase [Streptomyces sp. NBC_01217]
MLASTLLTALDLPDHDSTHLTASGMHFPDGADYRTEVPVVNSIVTFRALVRRTAAHHLVVNRVTETLGMFRHTRTEITEYVNCARDEGIALIMSVGPRASYDTSATRAAPHGSYLGYRLRGMDQIRRAVDDVLRGIELGVRGFVVYDEGLLSVLGEARRRELLPPDVWFKASAHMGCGNPVSARLLERLGADSVNPVRDLSLDMLRAIRGQLSVPIDLHTDNPPSSGGFVRTYEAPDMVRVARPVYLKSGNSMLREHGQFTDASDGERMADQVAIVRETLERFAPELTQSPAQAALGRQVDVA